jgi:acyl dehydratase
MTDKQPSLWSLSLSLLPLATRRVPAWSARDPLPSLSARRSIAIEASWLQRYRSVIGAHDDGFVPTCAPQVVAAPLHREIMMAPLFPFAAMGLVHIHNTIIEHHPIAADAHLQLHARLDGHQPHAKGIAFRITTDAVVADRLVWTSTMTVLSRRRVDGPTASAREPSDAIPGVVLSSSVIRMPADLGRRYAVVAGDANPIHLSMLSARPFGFRRAIAHGMWTLGRALAESSSSLPPLPRKTEVRFVRPVLLPSQAVVTVRAPRDNSGCQLTVHPIHGDTPHLTSEISRIVG